MKKIILFSFSVILGFFVNAQNPLFIPDTLTGTDITLTLQEGTSDFYPGITSQTMGANGSLLGPTLLLNQGDSIDFHVVNQLADTTTIHWHGMHVSAENDGGPHSIIPPGETWNPSFRIYDKAATYWYHPHLHSKTNLHVSKGIAGFILVRDVEEATLDLPRTYGVDDFPAVLQTKAFDPSNEIEVGTAMDTAFMINGTVNPMVDFPAQFVRVRLLNGASERVFNLGLTNDETFYQITSDGGLLDGPVSLTRLMLAPGERAEVLLDLSSKQGQTIYLTNYGSEFPNAIYGASQPGAFVSQTIPDYDLNPLNGNDTTLLQINVVAPTSNPVTSMPSALTTNVILDSLDANASRLFLLSASQMGPDALNHPFQINGESFDMNVINEIIPLNNIEVWEVYNGSQIAHPFHVHDIQFNIISRSGVAPPPNEAGRKDVVFIKSGESVKFIAKFDHFSSDTVPYMYHCHMLTHEDMGMMGQFLVVNNVGILEIPNTNELSIYPNPGSDQITIQLPSNEQTKSVEVFDLFGKLIKTGHHSNMDISDIPKGIYTIKVSGQESHYSTHFIKE